MQARSLSLIGMLLVGACRGGAGGDAVATSAAAVTARTWGLAYLQQNQLPQAEAEFRKHERLQGEKTALPRPAAGAHGSPGAFLAPYLRRHKVASTLAVDDPLPALASLRYLRSKLA